MDAVDREGRKTGHTRREALRPTPRGPLAQHQVADLQAMIAKGLVSQGYTQAQVTQVIPVAARTLIRRLQRV